MTAPLDDVHYFQLNQSVIQDPYPFFQRLRDEAPIYREPDRGVYMISRYDDIVEVLRQPELFSSIVVGGGPYQPMPPLDQLEQWRYAHPFRDRVISNDPPDHTRHRRVLSRLVSARRVASLENRVRQLVNGLLDGFIDDGQVEFVSAYSNRLPAMVMSELLGVPIVDQPTLNERVMRGRAELSKPANGLTSELDRMTGRISQEKQMRTELIAYFMEALEKRRDGGSQGDIMSELAFARFADGEPVPPEAIVTMVLLLYEAGAQSNTNQLLTNLAMALARDSALQRNLREKPDRIDAFVEEVLRQDSPLFGLFRVAMRDTELSGVPLAKGAILMVLYASANHDEEKFACPERFDSSRSSTQGHLTFGYGTHFCPGAALARLEARISVAELLRRMDTIRFADNQSDKIRYAPSATERITAELRLVFNTSKVGAD